MPAAQLPPTQAQYTCHDAMQSTRLVRHKASPATDSRDQLTRHVHFPLHNSVNNTDEDPVDEARRTTRPRPRPRPRPPPPQRSILRRAPNPTPTTHPTIYIVTFATDLIPNRPVSLSRLLDAQIPRREPPIPHLATIDARAFAPPPTALCARYSGISPLIQDLVMRDPEARRAVDQSIRAVMACGEKGLREVCLSVCCHAGTHRSVAVGERIAQGVKAEVGRRGGGEGVRIVVRHVSRVKGEGDPF
ncbi:hypothetical protein ACEQ8H_007707 [Pleosporales sp. CAS-2024a]